MRPLFFPTAKKVLIKPGDFFEKDISLLSRWAQTTAYLFFLTLIGAFFISNQPKNAFKEFTFTIVETFGLQDYFVGYSASTIGIAFLFIALVIVLLLATSFKYWVAHWYVRLWNKQATFQYTYAVLTYGGTPGWLAMPFSVLFFYLLYQATTTHAGTTWLLAILSFVVWMAFEGYSIYLRIYALAKVQKITRKQAVLSVYVLGLLTYLVGIVVIEFVVLFLLFGVLSLFGIVPTVA